MHERHRKLCEKLRSLSEDTSLEWLLTDVASDDPKKAGDAWVIFPHRSWSRRSQISLAKNFLPRALPNNHVLQEFASFMSIPLLTKLLWEVYEDDGKNLRFLEYHLPAIFEKAEKTDKSVAAVKELKAKIRAKIGRPTKQSPHLRIMK